MDPLDSNPIPSVSPSSQSKTRHTSINPGNNPQDPKTIPETEPISLSQTSQEIHRYTEALANLPDIRQEHITRIQKALESGTYEVSSNDLVDRLIQDILNPRPKDSLSHPD